jgi:dihydroorotate dehydrogenase electron transfer subunit
VSKDVVGQRAVGLRKGSSKNGEVAELVEHNPTHAAWYADAAVQRNVAIVANEPLARDTYRLRFECPEIARAVTPGQFLMLKIAGRSDPLIGRPLAMYDVVGNAVDVVYLVKGKFTSQLARLRPGERLDMWGPLGNGFAPKATEHLIMVAGGIGQTPFFALAQERLGRKTFGQRTMRVDPSSKISFWYGARSADYLACVEDFTSLGIDVQISTDDGSRGHHGLVTDLLVDILDREPERPHIVCCGPERMMEAVARIANERGVSCELSLETPMACGIGICFTCVAMIDDGEGHCDYRRTCVEGPVFDARRVVFTH